MAAGKGTRMRSALPKVAHSLCGQSMIAHVLAAASEAGAREAIVILGHEAPYVEALLESLPQGDMCVRGVRQEPQDGTGHAVATGLRALPERESGTTLILSGDMPLVTPGTLRALLQTQEMGDAPLTLLSAHVADPTGYGRIVRSQTGDVLGIREHKELHNDELDISEINCGVYCASTAWLRAAVSRLPRHPDGEYYLPDIVPLALEQGGVTVVQSAVPEEAQGVNTRAQLATAEALLRQRIIEAHMEAGVTFIDPAATYIDAGVKIGQDTVIHPGTHLRGMTRVGQDCVIGPDTDMVDSIIDDGVKVTRSVVESSRIGPRCSVGPFAHLRPGVVLHEEVEMWNHTEVKNSTIGARTAIHHFSYIGDATVGHDVNIGAGTVTMNYNGTTKNKTVIGDNVFVGSGTMLRAPITLGDHSYTGGGSVVLRDVASGTTVVGVPAREIVTTPKDTESRRS